MLRGELTNLRAIERNDSAKVHAWFDDPEIMHWWGYGARAVSLTATQAQIEQWIDCERSCQHPVAFVVEMLSGEAIGMMILSDLQIIDRGLELSCFLERAHRRQGFGRDALETLIDAVFLQWNYHRVTVRCESMNETAQAFFSANGFRPEGRLCEARFVDGAWNDVLIYGRVREGEPGA